MRPSRTSRWPTRTRTSATGRRSARPSGTVASRSRPRRRSARMAAPVAMRAALRPSDGLLSFRVAIITTVVGLLVVTCGFLLGSGIHAAQKSVGTLKNEYLEQVADSTVREVSRPPDTAEQILRVQRFRFETGLYSTSDPVALAGALQTNPDTQWVSYSEDATGRFMGGRRLEVVAILNDHFELLVGLITRHRGFVVDFLGDAVFAVFGAPAAEAAHAEYAVACA